MRKAFILVCLCLFAFSIKAQDLVAFPGAEGYGRFAKGARGAAQPKLYRVTTLADSGPGSFREAVQTEGNFVIFDVSGEIWLKSKLNIKSNITIAGQTAPGEGVVIMGNQVTASGSHDIIMRYMRFRVGSAVSGADALGAANGRDMIFDHISTSWATDENFSFYSDGKGSGIFNITIMNSLIGQGIGHSCGGLIRITGAGGISIIGTLYIDNKSRNPKLQGLSQYVNNVVYNWGSGSCVHLDTDQTSFIDMQNNYFINGPKSSGYPVKDAGASYQIHLKGNKWDTNRNGDLDGRDMTSADVHVNSKRGNPTFVNSYDEITGLDYPFPNLDHMMLTPEEAYAKIVEGAGASLPARDMVDAYMIDELVSLGTKGDIPVNEYALKLPQKRGILFDGNPYEDTDGDGIPDWWEIENGLNPNDDSDALQYAPDGYLWIEHYVNSIDGPAPYVKYPSNFQLGGSTFIGNEKYEVKLFWTNNEENADGLYLEVSTDKNFSENNTQTYSLGDVEAYGVEVTMGTAYYFRLYTVKGDLTSKYSSTVMVPCPDPWGAPGQPYDPTPEDGEFISDMIATTLAWRDVSMTIMGEITYDVYLGTDPDNLKLEKGGLNSKTLPVDLQPGTTYYWQVINKNTAGSAESEIFSFTTAERPERDTLAYYSHIDGNYLVNEFGPDAVVKDMSPVWIEDEGVSGNAISFSGENGAAFVQEHYEELDKISEESFSVEFWFKSAGGSGKDWYLIHKGSHVKDTSKGTTGKWFGVQYNTTGSNNRLTWGVDSDGDDKTYGKTVVDATAANYFKDEWVHFVGVRDIDAGESEQGEIRMYLNGELVGTTSSITYDIGTDEDMAIGNCNSDYTNAFEGLIDNIVIYEGALTDGEASANYILGLREMEARVGIEQNQYVERESVEVHPIPFTDELKIQLNDVYTGSASIQILNTAGQMVWAENAIAENGKIVVSNLDTLPRGYYICNIVYQSKSVTAKVVK